MHTLTAVLYIFFCVRAFISKSTFWWFGPRTTVTMHLFMHREEMVRVHHLPRHVLLWMEEHEDVLVRAYEALLDALTPTPYLMDRMDFLGFCALVARLSTIDSPCMPWGRAGGRHQIADILLPAERVATVDAAVASRWPRMHTEPPEVDDDPDAGESDDEW
jgi:hypothetical protein